MPLTSAFIFRLERLRRAHEAQTGHPANVMILGEATRSAVDLEELCAWARRMGVTLTDDEGDALC